MNDIVKARSDADIAAVTELAWEFVDFLRTRYPERLEDLELYLKKQRFTEMLANFRDHFNPPKGECFLARLDDRPVGIVMLKANFGKACEMNRMFVRAEARGRGIGRALCNALIAEARALGYAEMRLGALDRHVEALPLYRSLGFAAVPARRGAQDDGVIHMRLTLAG